MSGKGGYPRILYVSPFWPRKTTTDSVGFQRGGSQVRSLSVLSALQRIGTVQVVILDDEGAVGELVSEPNCDVKIAYTLAVKSRRSGGLIQALRWTLNPRANYPNGCSAEPGARDRFLETLEDFDVVWFFKLRSPDMFPNAAWPCSVVDIDDVPSTYERATLHLKGGLRECLSARRREFSWRSREKLLGERFTVLTVCSEEDRQYLRRLGVAAPIHVISNGFEVPSSEPLRSPVKPPRLGFIGLFDHFPNNDGIRWFVDNCWQQIKDNVPEARLRLVGLGSDGPLKPLGPDIDGLGWLSDPSDEIRSWSLMVVPIRVGGGTRVKIAQGFSQKCPIVSTPLGACGYPVQDGRELYIARSSEEFSDACIKLIREPETAAQLAERAWSQFLERWTWEAIAPRVSAAVEDCLRISR